MFVTTTNQKCNYKNPNVFSYPIPISKSALTLMTPFFVAFDSDSIPGNNEIFLKTFYYSNHDLTIINVSQSLGDDIEPRVCYIFSNDTVFVAVIWKHIIFGKTDIWMAKTSYIPQTGVEDAQENVNSFKLIQNFPNPFNPTTKIEYQIPSDGTQNIVSLRVYDIFRTRSSHIGKRAKTGGKIFATMECVI